MTAGHCRKQRVESRKEKAGKGKKNAGRSRKKSVSKVRDMNM
jgi:hypothetical protein